LIAMAFEVVGQVHHLRRRVGDLDRHVDRLLARSVYALA